MEEPRRLRPSLANAVFQGILLLFAANRRLHRLPSVQICIKNKRKKRPLRRKREAITSGKESAEGEIKRWQFYSSPKSSLAHLIDVYWRVKDGEMKARVNEDMNTGKWGNEVSVKLRSKGYENTLCIKNHKYLKCIRAVLNAFVFLKHFFS